jgi:hypothetical protein
MRSNVYWRRAIFVVVIAGGCFVSLTPEFGVIGVGVVEAKSYYTRKRINGVWVKGRFAKRSAVSKRETSTTSKAARRSRTASLPATTGSLSGPPDPVTAPAAAVSTQALVQASSLPQTAWLTRGTTAAAPSGSVQGAAVAQTTSTPGALAPQTVLSSPGVSGARTPSPAVPYMAPGAQEPPLVAPSDEQRLSKLREALQARANSLANGGSGTPAPLMRPAPEPQSVTFDFKSGVKTTIFADGTIVEDAFDVAAVRGMASTPPAASSLGLR